MSKANIEDNGNVSECFIITICYSVDGKLIATVKLVKETL